MFTVPSHPQPQTEMNRKRIHRINPLLIQKRVAFVCFSRSLGGLELSTLRLAKAMSEKGVEAFVIIPPSSPLQQRASELGLKTVAIEPRWKYGDPAAAFRLRRALRKNRIDIAILMQSKDIHLAALATLGPTNTKLVFYQQMDSGYNKRDFVHTWLYSRLSLWISLTQRMRNNVLTFTRMGGEKVMTVPLGVDLQEFDPVLSRKPAARSFFKLPKKGRIVGVLGRLDPQKGQEIVLRAIPAVAKQFQDIHLLLAGDETAGEPGYKAHLVKLCTDLGIKDRVIFLPFTDEVARLMSALDIFILPSFSETYGLVVIEAMAMGLPVIATNAGGVPEIIADGRTGILVEPRDSDAIARAICRLLKDTRFRSKITRAARIDAQQRFDFKLCVNKLLDSISSL